jgi:hypothetical protein
MRSKQMLNPASATYSRRAGKQMDDLAGNRYAHPRHHFNMRPALRDHDLSRMRLLRDVVGGPWESVFAIVLASNDSACIG